MLSKHIRQTILLLIFACCIAECGINKSQTPTTVITPFLPTSSIVPAPTLEQRSPDLDLSHYAFPDLINPTQQYIFYLHGKIIEDQGIPAVDPDYGEYEYQAILEKLSSYGFVVISEQRVKNTDSLEYAKTVTEQITTLMKAGVPAKNITVVGASKGAGIAVYVSHLLENIDVNFVIMAICNPDNLKVFKQDQTFLFGNILSIYDSSDKLAGSCQELFDLSKDKGISNYKELVLNIGTGHGILYKPLDEWIIPVIQWAGKP